MTSSKPMDVEQFGVDPARLRKFLRDMSAYKSEFTTPQAMEALGLSEPEGTRAFVGMGEAKWLVYLGEHDKLDQWKVGRLGIQFSMKNFLKRMPVAKAEELLERTIDAARAFNATDASTRITRLALFGSLATGGDGLGTVGDVDLQLAIGERAGISEQERAELLIKEARPAPKRSTFDFDGRFWARNAGLRHIRAVSKHLTVSTHDNIGDMGCEHRIVYWYDAKTGLERPSDRKLIPADDEKQSAFNIDAEHEAPLPQVPEFRPWPRVPARRPTGLCERRPSIDWALAQYLWQRGAGLKVIARRLAAKEVDVQAVLAQSGIELPETASIIMTDSPIDALAPFLAGFPDIHANIRLGDFGSYGTVIVRLRRGRYEASCSASPTKAEAEGDPELAPLAEVIAKAGALWHKRFRSKTPKISLSTEFDLAGALDSVSDQPSTMKAASRLGVAFNRMFDEFYHEANFETVYEDRRIRSVSLYLDLLHAKLQRSRRDGSKKPIVQGELAEPARMLADALVGRHGKLVSSIELYRHQAEWEHS